MSCQNRVSPDIFSGWSSAWKSLQGISSDYGANDHDCQIGLNFCLDLLILQDRPYEGLGDRENDHTLPYQKSCQQTNHVKTRRWRYVTKIYCTNGHDFCVDLAK